MKNIAKFKGFHNMNTNWNDDSNPTNLQFYEEVSREVAPGFPSGRLGDRYLIGRAFLNCIVGTITLEQFNSFLFDRFAYVGQENDFEPIEWPEGFDAGFSHEPESSESNSQASTPQKLSLEDAKFHLQKRSEDICFGLSWEQLSAMQGGSIR